MTVRAVEGKKPYTGGIAIEVTEDKVINLRLRDENNLIIWDEGDNEIYVDLQLPDGIKPTDAFPVGITTGRVLVADDWDVTGTIICAKTTSGDNIKVLYGDDNKLYVDNGTGLFKEVSFKADVDLAIQTLRAYVDQQLALKQDKLTAGNNITIDQNNVISAMLSASSRFLSLWDSETGMPISFPGTIPFEYETGDHFLVENIGTTNYRPDGLEYDGTASTTVETEDVAIGDMYYFDGASWLLQQNHDPEVSFSQIAGQPTDNTNLATALNGKQDTLTAGANITIDSSNQISATDTIYTAGTNVQISNQNVISATDTTYTAGTGVNIDGNDEISIDTTVVATQTDLSNGLANKQDTLTAGLGIDITNNTISTKDVVIDMSSIIIGDDWRVSGLVGAFGGISITIVDYNLTPNYYKVWKAEEDQTGGQIIWRVYASNGGDNTGHTTGFIIEGTISQITSITPYTEDYFTPGAGTTGQILRKTANGYEWSNESGAVTSVNNQTGAVTVTEFLPSGTPAIGDVVTKTANGYEWAAPSGGTGVVHLAGDETITGVKTFTANDGTVDGTPAIITSRMRITGQTGSNKFKSQLDLYKGTTKKGYLGYFEENGNYRFEFASEQTSIPFYLGLTPWQSNNNYSIAITNQGIWRGGSSDTYSADKKFAVIGDLDKRIFSGATAPSNPVQGTLWYDTVNNKLMCYDGNTWNLNGGEVMVSTQTGNQFTPGMKIWGGTSSDLSQLTQDLNTLYMAY